jgi:hypothetical protein
VERRFEWREERSLALHQAVARHVAEDPSLITRALAQLNRWEALARRAGSDRRLPARSAWRELLVAGTLEEIIAALLEDSPRARRLRRFSPFAGALPEAERLAILERFEAI